MNKLPIAIDTREQLPFDFKNYTDNIHIMTLNTGDYSLAGYEKNITIERKSIGDLASCMTVGRERFCRELERMKDFESAAVIVEQPLNLITNGHYRSSLNPVSFEQSILSFIIKYRVPFLFGKNRSHASWLCFNCLRHFWNSKQTKTSEKIQYIPFNR